MITRCNWVTGNPLYIHYHDHEWGAPIWDDCRLFECLTLESAQAGLNWLTILKKREGYRQAFCQFDPEAIAALSADEITSLYQNSKIIRHRQKIDATINNANAYLDLKHKGISFSNFIWRFVDGTPIINHWSKACDVPTQTPLSACMAKALKQHGFTFVGSTICYAFMQAIGMVNDHTLDCFKRQ